MTYGVRMGPTANAARWRDERRLVRKGPGTPYRKLQSLAFLLTRDRDAARRFLAARYPIDLPYADRLRLIRGFVRVTNAVRGYHTLSELLTVADRILRLSGRPELTVVEAGSGSGSSTAKLSLVTKLAGGRLHVFDTFRGIPDNDEAHELLDGRRLTFMKGAFRGRLGAVKRRVERYGAIDVCEFHKGLFADTLPGFDGPVDVALLDVDLVASTRTCIAHLYPKLRSGGAMFSQDGHLRATLALLRDDGFWAEIGVEPPAIYGLGEEKMIEVEAAQVVRVTCDENHSMLRG